MAKKKLRRLGDITQDMEPLLMEMAIDHDMQVHEILGVVLKYLQMHCPGSVEEYTDGTKPVHYYGHQEGLK